MNKLQDQLKSVSKSLASLSKQVDRISKSANKLHSAKPATTARKPASKRAAISRGKTVLDTVLDGIKRSRKGATIAQLKAKTELDARQLSNALYKLTKKGLIRAQSRGLYVKK
jgi:predicted Rossmann fold nucleotide-binding protein DprA/Smf involved in DNA uptake